MRSAAARKAISDSVQLLTVLLRCFPSASCSNLTLVFEPDSEPGSLTAQPARLRAEAPSKLAILGLRNFRARRARRPTRSSPSATDLFIESANGFLSSLRCTSRSRTGAATRRRRFSWRSQPGLVAASGRPSPRLPAASSRPWPECAANRFSPVHRLHFGRRGHLSSSL